MLLGRSKKTATEAAEKNGAKNAAVEKIAAENAAAEQEATEKLLQKKLPQTKLPLRKLPQRKLPLLNRWKMLLRRILTGISKLPRSILLLTWSKMPRSQKPVKRKGRPP